MSELKDLSDKEKFKALQNIRKKKKELSPEAFEAYREKMMEMMDMEEPEEDDIEKKANQRRKALRKIREGSLIKKII